MEKGKYPNPPELEALKTGDKLHNVLRYIIHTSMVGDVTLGDFRGYLSDVLYIAKRTPEKEYFFENMQSVFDKINALPTKMEEDYVKRLDTMFDTELGVWTSYDAAIRAESTKELIRGDIDAILATMLPEVKLFFAKRNNIKF